MPNNPEGRLLFSEGTLACVLLLMLAAIGTSLDASRQDSSAPDLDRRTRGRSLRTAGVFQNPWSQSFASATPPNMLTRWFQRTVLSRRWLAFLVMGLAFFVFGVGTYNFFLMLSANLSLIAEYG